MASTYSSLLRLELIGTGDQPGTWGITTNTNLGTLIEQAVAATATFSVTLGNITLSELNGSADQSRCAALLITGSAGVSRDVIAPALSKLYVVSNTADAAIILKTSSSTGLTIPSGVTQFAYYNGTDFIAVSQPYDADLKAIADLASTGLIARTGSGTAAVRSIAVSGTGLSIANADGVAGNPTITSNATNTNTTSTIVARDSAGDFSAGTITATLSGTATNANNVVTGGTIASNVTATTQSAGTNNTTIATTAFVATAIGNINFFPSGGIIMWSGSIVSIPSGWYLCNGSNGTPDLRNRFIVGAGSTYSVGGTGGSADAVVVAHTHNITDPGHTHTPLRGRYAGSGDNYDAVSTAFTAGGYVNVTGAVPSATTGISVDSAGVSGVNANLPPFYALAYIMKA